MEHTGSYWRPIALTLVKAGFFVSVVNAMLIHDFRDNSLRRVKTDKADALKIANYALAFWPELRPYTAEDETRQLLKMQCRLYERTLASSVALRNSLISLLDQVFPGVNRIFYQMVRADNGATLGSFSAAARYAPTVRYKRVDVYVESQFFDEFVQDMDLSPVESGGNVRITIPHDETPCMFTRTINGSLVTSPMQTVLDLLGNVGRGEEAADAIISKEYKGRA